MIGINGTSMVPTPEHVRHHLIHMPNTFLQHLSLQPFGKSKDDWPSGEWIRLFSFKNSTYIDFINSSTFSEPASAFKVLTNDSLSI